MANPGNNPSGINQFLRNSPGYGGVQQGQQLQRSAPMSGAPVAAVNAPRRAQRAATHGRKAQAPQAPTVAQRPPDAFAPTSAPPPEPQGPDLASVWNQIAQIPGVTPLAAELAQRAAGG